MTAEERVDYRAQITALLPAHTHRTGGRSALLDGTTWAWTTPDGTWRVSWGGFGLPTVVTPYGRLTLPREPEVAFRRLLGVLVALGGVEPRTGSEG